MPLVGISPAEWEKKPINYDEQLRTANNVFVPYLHVLKGIGFAPYRDEKLIKKGAL